MTGIGEFLKKLGLGLLQGLGKPAKWLGQLVLGFLMEKGLKAAIAYGKEFLQSKDEKKAHDKYQATKTPEEQEREFENLNRTIKRGDLE